MTADPPAVVALDHGTALREQGRLREAAERLREAVAADPELVAARFQLGLTLLLDGRSEEALEPFAAALRLDPQHRLTLLNAGNACNNLGRFEEAREWYQRALDAGAPFGMGYNNLGKALQNLGRLEEAAAAYERGLELAPHEAYLLGNLSSVCQELGDLGRLAMRCRALIHQHPGAYHARIQLSVALQLQGQLDAAARAATDACERDVDAPQAHFQLGSVQHERGLVEDAVVCFENALAADPTFAPARNSLAGALHTLGKLDEALEEWARALEAAPDYHTAASNRLLCLNYSPRVSSAELFAEHQRWGERVELEARAPATHPNDTSPDRRLRVGYVSADLREHPVAAFLEPVLTAHDPRTMEVTCYSSHAHEDATTARLRQAAHHWRRVAGASDAALAAAIRDDRIDVLVDLGGHTGGSRLTVFARRPAPVQVTWIGYPGTTGLTTVDARLTDRWADPEGEADAFHTERLIRLERCFLCYRPPADAPPIAPASDPEQFTFGSFNNMAKLAPPTIALWARVLLAAPGARLLIKNASLAHPAARARLEGLFAAHGVSSRRLRLMGRLGRREHLDLYNQVGLHLDPFPYAGTATTCEAAFMGVPTLTLVGERHAGRVGVSLLAAIGLPELITESPERYLERAVELARSPSALQPFKSGLRERLLSSPLTDAAAAARAVEHAFRDLWADWCNARHSSP